MVASASCCPPAHLMTASASVVPVVLRARGMLVQGLVRSPMHCTHGLHGSHLLSIQLKARNAGYNCSLLATAKRNRLPGRALTARQNEGNPQHEFAMCSAMPFWHYIAESTHAVGPDLFYCPQLPSTLRVSSAGLLGLGPALSPHNLRRSWPTLPTCLLTAPPKLHPTKTPDD